jgi:hypothetical protein
MQNHCWAMSVAKIQQPSLSNGFAKHFHGNKFDTAQKNSVFCVVCAKML